MRDNNLYVRVDRIQSLGEYCHFLERRDTHKPSHGSSWHANGKSSKDVYLERRAEVEALKLEFRL